jgi:hypothetical protein
VSRAAPDRLFHKHDPLIRHHLDLSPSALAGEGPIVFVSILAKEAA